MPIYNPAELNALYVRCQQILGEEVYESIVNSPPRFSGFVTSLEADIEFNNGNLSKIKDHHIEGALEIALEVWPYEVEAVASVYDRGEAS